MTNAVAGFPRRDRAVVDGWKHAATMRYWHRRDVFAVAEEFGRRLLIDLDHPPSREDLSDLIDESEHAATVDRAALDAPLRKPATRTRAWHSTVSAAWLASS